jgi:ABC-type nitrate/sulfonate/bicarbonate transport system substrate-binding protein
MLALQWRWMQVAALAVVAGGAVAWYSQEAMVDVSISVPARVRSAALYVAMDKGFFAAEGLHVTLRPFTTGKEGASEAAEGRIDLAAVASLPVLDLLAKGKPVAILGSLAHSHEHVGILTRKDLGGDLNRLRGRRIGVMRATASELFALAMLDAAGVPIDTVTLVDVQPEAFVDALPSGHVDALSAWQPVLGDAQRRLGDDSAVFRNDGTYVDYWLLICGTSWIDRNPAVAERVLRALVRANEFIRTDESEAKSIARRYIPAELEDWSARIFGMRMDLSLRHAMETNVRIGLRRDDLPGLVKAFRPEVLRRVAPSAVTIER